MLRTPTLTFFGIIACVSLLAPEIVEAGTIHHKSESRTASASNCVNDASFGTRTWTNPQNASSSDNIKATVSVDGTVSNYIKCTSFGFAIPQSAIIKEIRVSVERVSDSTGNGGSNDAAIRIVKGGTIGTVDFSSGTIYTTSDVDEEHASTSVPLWGQAWTPADVNASNFGAAVAVTKPSAAGQAHNVSIDQIKVTVYYSLLPMIASQQGSIFENDDSASNVDGRSAQAAASTSIASVAQGERVNARFHLRMASSSATTTLGLFWDKNDGVWTKVTTNVVSTTTAHYCSDTDWGCHYVDTSGDVGEYASVAIDPSGNPWVSYFDSTNTSLRVARYVGSGGTGCADSAWTCMTIDNTDTNGYFSSLAFDKDGNAWISYEDLINSGLRVARYVGSGGTGCSDAAWTCTLVDSTNSVGRYTSIAADPFGNPWVSYYDTTNGDLRVARYVGTGGTGCADAAWTCVAVESTNDVGKFSSIVLDTSGNAWVSYYDITNSDLRVARYVGSGGSGCASSAWTCVAVYTTNDVGQYTSIAIDPSGNPWVAHTDASMSIIRTARYVGTGGSNCASGEWTCSTAGGAASAFYGRIAFDPSGNPWVSFVNPIGYTIGVARYVGSGGVSCSGSEWTCETIDTVNSAGGYYTSLAFDPNGIPWVAYSSYTSRDLRVARIMPRGIPFVPAASVAQGVASTTRVSHADMTSVSDTTNRNDADCVQTGGTWINGVSAGGEEITFAPWRTSGSGELCTEVNFALDTTHAATNTTYRLVVSMKDGWRPDVGVWRGLATTTRLTVHASTTIVSSGTAIRVLKGTSAGFGPCAHASWTCMTFNVAFQEGYYSDIEFDARGNPWTPYFNLTTGDLYVARYVGSSGTGCDASSWMCELIDTSSSDIGQQPSLAFDPSGNPWIAYPDSTNGDLKIARYVGSGGTGCSSSAWTCESIDTTNSVGNDPDVAFDLFGDPWIAYKDQTNTDLRIAHYVGVAGSGCVHTAWTCITVDATSSDVGNYPSLAFDAFGRPWVGYHDATNFDLRVARYVGAGGTGCAVSQWTCETADSSGDVGNSASLEFDRAGRAWIASQQNTGGDLRVTRYVGSGGSGCSSSAWTCSTIVTTNTIGAHISLAIDAQDRPWISFYDATPNDLRVARYVGSGGSGCDDSAWMCQTVDSTNTVGEYNSLAFDPYGVPWVAYRNGSSDEFRVAKLATSTTRYFATTSPMLPGSSAKPGRMLMLDAGKSPRIDADGTCNAATDLQGYCGISLDDAVAEGVTADPSSRTLFAFEAFTTLSATPTLTWIGRSTTAPSTQSIFVEIYRAGTTNDWIPLPLTTNTCASAGTNTDCTIIGTPTAGTHAEYHYYDTRTWGYRTQFRITQIAPVYATTTLKTDHVVVTYPAALTQTHYRWRNDDGTETNASFAVNQDTILSSVPYTGDRIRLRLLLSNDGVAAATNKLYRLDFSSSSCSTYIPLGNYDDTASEWIADFSQWAPDGAASSNHSGLSDPEGKSFVAGEIRAGGRKTNTHALTSSQFTELEYTFRSTLAAIPSITYCFRVSDDGDDSEFSYPVIAQLILRGGARPQTGGGGAGGESQGSGSQQQGGGASGGSGAGGEGSGSGGSQQGGGAGGGGDSG